MSATGPTALGAGSKLGPYVVRGLIGAGGMGEVYRAHDSRLGRDVAIKVLPAAASRDPDRLRRLEQEARSAGSLNHPNVLAVFDVGSHGDAPYIVSELLEGESLRARLNEGPLPSRGALDYAAQAAEGLAAAHEKGIVHRDLKPENLFLTRDGRVKILDFGLAKLSPTPQEPDGTASTASGQVLGTVGYMSPEQVRGVALDHRTDIFALGAVLYEMLSGKRAFRRATGAETMTATLREDPPALSGTAGKVSLALDLIVRRCLEKRPEDRFQSARDLAFALRALSGGWETGSGARPLETPARLAGRRWVLAFVGLLATVAAASFLAGRQEGQRPPPSFRRLTFRRGASWSARFAPDGQTIVYGAAWEGQPIRLYATRPESPESRPFDLPDADILAISSQGEMAISLHRNPYNGLIWSFGTLARAPLAGGAPREVLEDVQGADWSPDGKELAVIHRVGNRRRLEYPIGHVLEEGDLIFSPRVSPRGDMVAFFSLDEPPPVAQSLRIVDRSGNKRTLATGLRWAFTLAWSPKGNEIWFSRQSADSNGVYAVSVSGRQRLLARAPATPGLQDVFRDGRALVASSDSRSGIIGLPAGETRERDLSWLDFPVATDISANGKTVLFTENGEGAAGSVAVYLRRMDGTSPPVRLGEGEAPALSPDGKWALCFGLGSRPELDLLPTGAGEAKAVPLEGIEYGTDYGSLKWLGDGQHVVLEGRQPGRPWRSFVQSLAGGTPRPVTPDGIIASAVSPDGRFVAAVDPEKRIRLYPVAGGDSRIVPGPAEDGDVGPWSADGRYLFATKVDGLVMRAFRRELATGRREVWKEIRPADSAGIIRLQLLLTPDGNSYVYTYRRLLSSLYLAEGLD